MALPSPSIATLFGAGMTLLGVVVLAVSARYVWRATAVLRAADADSLAGHRTGDLVRLSGTVVEGDAEPFVAPFSGTAAVALRYAVEERRLSLVVLPWDVTIHEQSGGRPFGLRTAAATVPVAAPARSVVLDSRLVATVEPGEDPPERVAAAERDATALPATTAWRDPPGPLRGAARLLSLGRRRYLERRAGPGDEVTVVGRVTGDGGVDPLVVSDRSPAATAVRMARTSVAGVLVGVVAVLLGVGLLLA